MATKSSAPEGPSVIPPKHLDNTFFTSAPETPNILKPILKCGPLIRYHGTNYVANTARPLWRGSILIVTELEHDPRLSLWIGSVADEQDGRGLDRVVRSKLLEERGICFWRFGIEVELGAEERRVQYRIGFGAVGELLRAFWVPGKEDSMRIMVSDEL